MQPWKIAHTPEEAGLSSQGILNYLDAVKASGIEPHSILVLKDGMLACKMNFAPYDDQTPHILFSLSKSFCSAAAGFAVAEGLLDWDSRVLDVLSDKAPENPSVWLRSVTLHHLLTMGSGLDPKSDAMGGGEDWMKEVLACDCNDEPGTRFHYNSHGTYLVSAMVQRVTGMNIRDYLMPRLFEPLGIPKPEWDTCPQGVCVGGWGLHLSSDSIARFGLCVLQNGMWQGKQVLPPEWLEKATRKQIENAGSNPHPDWSLGYGYQFWRTRGNRFRGDGMFGQICMISREKNMVVAVTAGLNDMGKEMDLLNDYLFPAADLAPSSAQEQQALQERLATLGYSWPEHEDDVSVLAHAYEAENVQLTIAAHGVQLSIGQEISGRFGWFEPEPFVVENAFTAAPPVHWLGGAGWKKGKLSLLARTVEGPFVLKAEAVEKDGGLELTMGGVGVDERTVLLKKA